MTAASDQNTNNNQLTLSLAVNPASDIVATRSPTQVLIDNTITARITIENRCPNSASAASVTITPGGGLRIENANWANGNCSVTSNVAACDASSSLAVNSSSTINAVFTGTALGDQTFTVAASASEADSNTSNNSATGRVTMNSATTSASGDDSGGGGAFRWLALLLLSALYFRRLFRPIRQFPLAGAHCNPQLLDSADRR